MHFLLTRARHCWLFECQVLEMSRRIMISHMSSHINDMGFSKIQRSQINSRYKQPNLLKRVGKENRSWLIDEKVYANLRRSVLLTPKFDSQISQPIQTLGSEEFNDLNSKFREQLKNLSSVENLHELLSAVMVVVDRVDKDHVMPLLERECCLRLSSWSVKEILLAMDIFYCCQWKAAPFYRSSFRWFDLKMDDLTLEPHDILQLLFYVALYRNAPITLMRRIEQMLIDLIHFYSPLELGLVCHAFFVTNTCILSYDLLEQLSCKLIDGLAVNSMPGPLVGNYLKVFRHAYYEDMCFYQQLGDRFLQQLPQLGTYANLQLFKTFSSLHFYHQNYCLAVVNFWGKTDPSKTAVRFKTMVDIMSSCIVFQIKPPTNIIDELMNIIQTKFKDLSRLYPEKFIEGLLALVMSDRYPVEAISHALSPRVKKEDVILEQMYQCQLIDESVELFCPAYQGYRLPERWIMRFQNHKANLIKQLEWRKGFRVLLETLQQLLGKCVHIDTVLLSSQVPVLVINVDEDNVAIPLSDDEPVFFNDTLLSESLCKKQVKLQRESKDVQFSEDRDSIFDQMTVTHDSLSDPLFHHLPDLTARPNGRKLVVMLLGRNQFHKNEDRLHGLYMHFIRMMLALGYEVIGISPRHAEQVEYMTTSEVENFTRVVILDKFGVKY